MPNLKIPQPGGQVATVHVVDVWTPVATGNPADGTLDRHTVGIQIYQTPEAAPDPNTPIRERVLGITFTHREHDHAAPDVVVADGLDGHDPNLLAAAMRQYFGQTVAVDQPTRGGVTWLRVPPDGHSVELRTRIFVETGGTANRYRLTALDVFTPQGQFLGAGMRVERLDATGQVVRDNPADLIVPVTPKYPARIIWDALNWATGDGNE